VAQAWAFLQTRQFVTPDDIQQVATSVLDVRLAGNESHMEGVVQEILEAVPVP
jgi:MoxR-like ATPase